MSILKGVKEQIDVKVIAECNSDVGRTIKVPFVITARKPKQAERKEILRQINEGEVEDETVIQSYLLDWKELRGEDGNLIDYSDDVLEEVLQAPEYVAAIVRGIMEAIVGKSAISKN